MHMNLHPQIQYSLIWVDQWCWPIIVRSCSKFLGQLVTKQSETLNVHMMKINRIRVKIMSWKNMEKTRNFFIIFEFW